MMKATDILLKEHELILTKIAQLGIDLQYPLKYRCSAIKRGLEFIINFIDVYHHAREEDIYFEWMDIQDKVYKEGPVKCMFDEHDLARSFTDSAKTALDSFLQGNPEAEKEVKENLRFYISLMIDHIEKENTMIYPMANQLNDKIGGGDEYILPKFESIDKKFNHLIAKYLG